MWFPPDDPKRNLNFQGSMTANGTKGGPLPRWRVALLLLSSACLSGIAVVLWNRKILTQIRNEGEIPPETQETEFI